MDYKAEIERTKAAFDLLLPYVQCDKDEFMATASADAKLAMLMNGWANPWHACHFLSQYASWCARKGKIRSKISTEMSREITSALARRIRQMYEKIREYPLPDDYRGSYDEMRQLLSHLGITDSQTLRKMNDNFMRLMNKHPTIDVFALEDYIQSAFADYDNNVSLSEFLTKHDPENLPLWEFYCGVSNMQYKAP